MLLFLDIDGTLLPFGATGPYPVYEARSALPPAATAHPLLNRVDPAWGARLTGLGCTPVWATTWGEDANACLAPWIGLPALPGVDWPEDDDIGDEGTVGLHWKTRPLVDWAALPTFVLSGSSVTCVGASSGRSGRHGRDNRVATGWAPLIDRSDGG